MPVFKYFSRPKPVVLMVLDGWGVNEPFGGNAIAQADTPVIRDLIRRYPAATLSASGESVGLPWGESGNSEVGHLSLGLGRIFYQDLPRINRAIGDQGFYSNPAFIKAIEHVQGNGGRIHVLGLLSTGGVHSSLDHWHAFLLLLKRSKITNACLHPILDGRDTPFNSGVGFVKGLIQTAKKYGVGSIASLSGRFFTMDRNNNWDRTAKAYAMLARSEGLLADDPIEAIEASYKKKVYDEEFPPTVVMQGGAPVGGVKSGDSVVFLNFRPDRARQIVKALALPDFDKFERPKVERLMVVTMTEYEKGLPVSVAFPPEEPIDTLGETLARIGLRQLRIAETEKYAHVTYFFNGGKEKQSTGEDRVLVPSPAVENYADKPEMSALEVTKKLVEAVEAERYDFILVNYANADMVGHTGNIPAAINAIETVDACVGRVVKSVLLKNGIVAITADHGNAESMFNMQTGQMNKEHSSNVVPFILVGQSYEGRNVGWPEVPTADLLNVPPFGILADVAPTILKLMNVSQPKAMTGRSLI